MGTAYQVLVEQAKRARRTIGEPTNVPFVADGIYLPSGDGPFPADTFEGSPLTFAVLGDSAAAGLGAESPAQLPAVQLAKGLAEEARRAVHLTTYAIVGATTADLPPQIAQVLLAKPAIALIIIGSNDVTSKLRIKSSAELLGAHVAELTEAGIKTVVGTCPNLSMIKPIAEPLRSLAGAWSTALGKAQEHAVRAAGGRPVSLADLFSPELIRRPREMFSPDRFHPNGQGYELAAALLLAPLCDTAGVLVSL
jgi:lysophospholipase L1-like esterase